MTAPARLARQVHAPSVTRTAGRSHVGAVRSRNQDRWLARETVGLWAVADGMGGHQFGEMASGLIVAALGAITPCGSAHALLSAVRAQVLTVNADLIARAGELAPGAVVGSTIVALAIFEGHCAAIWAGDSRAYRLRAGRLERMTTDHSLVQAMVDAGELTAQAAAGHARANVITRAVGACATLELEVRYWAVEPGDTYLLASDGLTDALADAEIARALHASDLEAAADTLLELSLARGAADNVTFVIVATS